MNAAERETAKTTSVETKTVLVDYTASIALVEIKSKPRQVSTLSTSSLLSLLEFLGDSNQGEQCWISHDNLPNSKNFERA